MTTVQSITPSGSFFAHMSHMSSSNGAARRAEQWRHHTLWKPELTSRHSTLSWLPPTALPGCGTAAVGHTDLHPFIESALRVKDNVGYLCSKTHTPQWRVTWIEQINNRSTTRLPLLTMETCSSSHKKQKLSNAAENWVSLQLVTLQHIGFPLFV